MQTNMGSADRIIRAVVALVLLYLIVSDVVTGILAIILGIVAGALLLTSFISFCPLYVPLGLSTKRDEPSEG